MLIEIVVPIGRLLGGRRWASGNLRTRLEGSGQREVLRSPAAAGRLCSLRMTILAGTSDAEDEGTEIGRGKRKRGGACGTFFQARSREAKA